MSENSIQVNIGGRIYTPHVTNEEVEYVVKAAGLINERMEAFGRTYAVQDKQDLLAMCCLQLATQFLENESTRVVKNQSVSEQIISLDKVISEHLNKEK